MSCLTPCSFQVISTRSIHIVYSTANEAAKSSYETIYDHRDPLRIVGEPGTNRLPDLVNNPITDYERLEQRIESQHIYGNVKVRSM